MSSGDAASPISRLAISIASTIATTTSSTPIARLPNRVEAGLMQHLGERHAREREHQADERAEVLEQHDR